MLSFEETNSDNILKVKDYYKYKLSRTSDYTVGAIYMWRDFYKSSFTIYEDMLFYKVKFLDRMSFTFPIGEGNLDKAMDAIKEYCSKENLPLWFCTVPDEAVPILTERYHGTVCSTTNRDWADYLYDANDLAEMAGRRFSGQRNHINKFKKLYPDYKYQEITSDNLGRVLDFLKDYEQNYGKDSDLAKEELKRSMELLPFLDKFGLVGGFIEVDNKIIAMSVGEIINDTLYCHIEKAVRDYPGSYQMIVKEFAKHNVTDQVKYINREEDVGDEGLRTSKLSYHPISLLNKHCVQIPY